MGRQRGIVQVLAGTVAIAGLIAVSDGVASAGRSSAKLEICVVSLEGYTNPGGPFEITYRGTKPRVVTTRFDSFGSDPDGIQFRSCKEHAGLQPGKYTLVQTVTASGWELSSVACHREGSPQSEPLLSFDAVKRKVRAEVKGSVRCSFHQVIDESPPPGADDSESPENEGTAPTTTTTRGRG